MGENKDNKQNDELNESFADSIKEAVDNLDILKNPSFLNIFKGKAIKNVPAIPGFEYVKDLSLILHIKAERFDRHLNKQMEKSSLTFFSYSKNLNISSI